MADRDPPSALPMHPSHCPLSPPCSDALPCGLRLVGYRLREDTSQLLGLLEIALDGRLDDEERRALDEARHAAERLHELHRDLLALAQLGVACADIDAPERVALGDVADQAARQAVQRAARSGRRNAVTVSGGAAADAFVPRHRLERAIRLLLEDAMTFTPDRAIQVAVERLDTAEGPACSVVVRDTGLGDPGMHTLVPTLDEGDEATTPVAPVAVGVFISRVLIHSIGGAMTFETGPGPGTTIRATFPAVPSDLPDPA